MKFSFAPLAAALGIALTATALPAGPPAPSGASLFQQRCQTCHSVRPDARAIVGPSLAGVVGRKAASSSFAYSPALKASGLTWTRANLDAFLQGPGQKVPGTRMAITIPDPAQRAAIIDFLATSGN